MTRRQEIIELLEKEKKSAQELANMFKVEMFEILGDLSHIRLSVKPRKLVMEPAQCRKCGFKFEERSKVKKPTKCPRCKGERIMAALFGID